MKGILLPPFSLWLLGAGLLLLAATLRRRGLLPLGAASLALAYLLSLAPSAHFLRQALEIAPALTPSRLDAVMQSEAPPQAIVVLSAGVQVNTAHLGGSAPDGLTLERLHFAARLARMTGLPVLVTGGRVSFSHASLGDLMAETLEADFGVPVTWREGRAENTAQNASYSADILVPQGIERVLLVTHAQHQRRAVWSFRRYGMQPVPAPFTSAGRYHFELLDLLPNLMAVRANYYSLHEWIGLLWYRLRYA